MTREYHWKKIAGSRNELNFNTNSLAIVEIGDRTICIGIHLDVLYGFSAKCPHASGRMEAGFIDAMGNIVCPVHRYRFSMKNGRNSSGEGYYLKTYPVEEREEGIFVGLT